MPRRVPEHLRRAIIVTGTIALIAAPLWSHAIAAPASASTAPVDVHALDLRIAALERRIAQLESTASAAVAAAPSASAAPTVVRAPFVVEDAAGKILMRVDRSIKTGFPRLTVGDSAGSAAALAATPEGGALQLIDAGNMVRIAALASKTRTGVTTFLRAGKTFTGANDDGLPVFQARNLGEIAVAELKAMMAQNGQLVLTNEAGDRLVVAGVATTGVGVIKMGPAGNGAAAVMGNIALPASEIQGRKK